MEGDDMHCSFPFSISCHSMMRDRDQKRTNQISRIHLSSILLPLARHKMISQASGCSNDGISLQPTNSSRRLVIFLQLGGLLATWWTPYKYVNESAFAFHQLLVVNPRSTFLSSIQVVHIMVMAYQNLISQSQFDAIHLNGSTENPRLGGLGEECQQPKSRKPVAVAVCLPELLE